MKESSIAQPEMSAFQARGLTWTVVIRLPRAGRKSSGGLLHKQETPELDAESDTFATSASRHAACIFQFEYFQSFRETLITSATSSCTTESFALF